MSVTTDMPFAWSASGDLVKARVTQCALSRVCGVCCLPLGRPIAFVATPLEVSRSAIHAPPLHVGCAHDLRGLPLADPAWEILTTSGFEFVRPSRDDADQRPSFSPYAVE